MPVGKEQASPRQLARRRNVAKEKRRREAREVTACEVCGWVPPAIDCDAWKLVHAHHVIPVAGGGTDDAANLVFLCPNHHAVAHRVGHFSRNRNRHIGPQTRAILIAALRAIDESPRAWHAKTAGEVAALVAGVSE